MNGTVGIELYKDAQGDAKAESEHFSEKSEGTGISWKESF